MTIDVIKKLYFDKGLSSREIGVKLGLSAWQVIGLMEKNNIRLRSAAQTQKLQFLRKPLSFKVKTALSDEEKILNIAGHMLYWAEGAKANDRTVDLANCDEKMILIFLKMIRQIYRVDEKRLRILIYCYSNQNPNELIRYWSKILHIPIRQFTKPYIRKDYDEKKINRMPHGLVHIRYNDKKLFMKIREEIGIIIDKLLGE